TVNKLFPANDHEFCQIYVESRITDPRIVHLLNEISRMGCKLPTPFFRCAPCLLPGEETPMMTAGYVLGSFDRFNDIKKLNKPNSKPRATDGLEEATSSASESDYKLQHLLDKPGIIICEDVLHKYGSMNSENNLVHELIHAYDDCRAIMNWADCDQIACTEIRASALSGECRSMYEQLRGHYNVKGQLMNCVRRRATLSLKHSRYCQDQDCEEIVDRQFDKCFADLEPFISRP
ncbi:mitochondrial inner membrane protease ATP23, partial [Acrasis kona]